MGNKVSSLVSRAQANDEQLGALDFGAASSTCATLTPEQTYSLCQALHQNTHVRVLDLNGQTAAVAGAPAGKALGDMLRSNRSLDTLRLSRTSLGDAGAAGLAEGLPSHPNLQTLHLQNACLGIDGIHSIAQALSAPPLKLLELKLDNNPGVTGGMDSLAEGVRSNRSIHSLHLAGCSLTPAAVQLLVSALMERGVQLQVLDLSGNGELGDEGGAALAALLRSPSAAPQRLNICSCGIGPAGGSLLLESFRSNSQAHQLDLVGNEGVGAEDAQAVQALSLNRVNARRKKARQ